MADNSKIEWTEATWNPVTGCSKISKGCLNCYAEKLSARLKHMGVTKYRNGFEVTLHPDEIERPLKWKESRIIFVNSMSDLFHETVPFDFIKRIFDTMNAADWHIFQVLTKRSERLKEVSSKLKWGNNIWMGVTVENKDYLHRIEDLSKTPAKTKFLSMEPLLSSISQFPTQDIDWVIVGGESGPHARIVNAEWIRGIKSICMDAGVPFFFKQWGGTNKKKSGRILDGKMWNEMPPINTNKKSYQLAL